MGLMGLTGVLEEYNKCINGLSEANGLIMTTMKLLSNRITNLENRIEKLEAPVDDN